MNAVGVHSRSGGDSVAVQLAKQALARANATVDADRRAHSPGCVACDQKLVDKAQTELASAQAAAAASLSSAGGAGGLSLVV